MATGATGFQGFMRDHAKEFSLFGNGVSLAGGALSALNQYQAGKLRKRQDWQRRIICGGRLKERMSPRWRMNICKG